jgi:hypothetical protein
MAAELSIPAVWMRSETATFPVGSPVAGLRLGVTDTVEIAGRFYPLLLARGIVGLESGSVWHSRPARGWIPGLHVGALVSVLAAPEHLADGVAGGLRGAAAIEGTAHWEPSPWIWPYVVAQGGIVLSAGRPVASVYTGAQARVTERWDVSLEAGIAGLNEWTRDYAQPYLDVGGHGAVWIGAAVTYRFWAPREGSP